MENSETEETKIAIKEMVDLYNNASESTKKEALVHFAEQLVDIMLDEKELKEERILLFEWFSNSLKSQIEK